VGGRVRAVDDRDETECAGAGAVDDLLQGQDEAGRGGDVADVDDPRALACVREEGLDEGLGRVERQGNRRADVGRAGAARDPLPGEVAGAVLEIGGEDLVAGAELERARGEVDARPGVDDEGEVGGIGAEVAREVCARGGDEVGRRRMMKSTGSRSSSSSRWYAW
jgi:hypothetical protein